MVLVYASPGEKSIFCPNFSQIIRIVLFILSNFGALIQGPQRTFFAGGPLSASKRKKVVYTADFRLYPILSTLFKPPQCPYRHSGDAERKNRQYIPPCNITIVRLTTWLAAYAAHSRGKTAPDSHRLVISYVLRHNHTTFIQLSGILYKEPHEMSSFSEKPCCGAGWRTLDIPKGER